jgi:glycosyltransferase involved in cell wall biosynthesis
MLRVDWTHVSRRASGIERLTTELFRPDSLIPLDVALTKSGPGRVNIFFAQQIRLPLSAILKRSDVFVFPGFPPSPIFALCGKRTVLYVHDVFLITRKNDLNLVGKLYLAPQFRLALKCLRYFFVNSETTERSLRALCSKDAQILLYRPPVRNVFGLSPSDSLGRPRGKTTLRAVAIGTIEPRKNFIAAAKISSALGMRFGCVELHIVGRAGWGFDKAELEKLPGVVMHGPLADAQVREVVRASDIYICSSHDEGLGLPLLEVQHGGLPVAAPDRPIFREVLGASGIFIDPDAPEKAAAIIADAMTSDWRCRFAAAASANLRRWDDLVKDDGQRVVSFLEKLLFECADDEER